MSRKPRFVLPGVPQHVIQRGHNCTPCFSLTMIIIVTCTICMRPRSRTRFTTMPMSS